MIMKLIDERTNKDFLADRDSIKVITTKGVLSYYSEYFTRSIAAMTILSVCFFVSAVLLQKKAFLDNASVLLILGWAACWCLFAASVWLILGELFSNNFMPYTLRQYKVLQLIKRIKTANSYDDIHFIFSDVSVADLSVLTKISAGKIRNLWVHSDEEFIARMNDVAPIANVASNEQKICVTFNDYKRTKVTIPIVKRVKGDESAIILTNSGIVYQRAA